MLGNVINGFFVILYRFGEEVLIIVYQLLLDDLVLIYIITFCILQFTNIFGLPTLDHRFMEEGHVQLSLFEPLNSRFLSP